MNRRRFLKSSMAVAAVCGTSGVASLFTKAAFAADSAIADGQTRRFDFSVLQAMAHDLARQPWGGAPRDLPPTLANLTPQAYNSIQYDAAHSLWNNVEERKLDIQFFHVGMGFRRRVRMFSLDAQSQQAREIHFRPELFQYNDAGVDTKQLEGQTDLGFAGFRVFKAPELARRDIVAFWAPATSARSTALTSTACRRAVWPLTPLPIPRKSSRISRHSGLKPSNLARRCSPSTRCSIVRASPAPISSP